MTLVIACMSKDGIIVAADSKAVPEGLDEKNNKEQIIEDTTKIFELSENCVALVYGHGTDDYETFFDVFKKVYKSHGNFKGSFDYDFCASALPEFLRDQYLDKIEGTDRNIGVIMAGANAEKELKICDMQSTERFGREAFCAFEDSNNYHFGGIRKCALEYFRDNKVVTELSGKDVALELKSLIEKTADEFPREVNKNIIIKQLNISGIRPIRI